MKQPLDYVHHYLGERATKRIIFSDKQTRDPIQVDFRRLCEAFVIMVTDTRSDTVSIFEIGEDGYFIDAECHYIGEINLPLEHPKAALDKIFSNLEL